MKIEPFKTCRLAFTWLSIYPPDEKVSRTQKFSYIALSVFDISMIFCLLIASLNYFKVNGLNHLNNPFSALSETCAFSPLAYIVVTAFILRKKIQEIFKGITTIFDDNKHLESFRHLLDANDIVEWIWRQYKRLVIGGFISTGLFCSIVSVIFCYEKYDHFDADKVYYGFGHTVPWSTKKLSGYLCLTVFDNFGAAVYLFTNGSIMLFFVSLCLHHRAFYLHFRDIAQQLETSDNNRNNSQIMVILIQFRMSVEIWFKDSTNIYGHFIMVQLLFGIISLSAVIIQLDSRITNPDTDLIFLFWAFLTSATNLFIYCFFGRMATESFEQMANCLFESNWRRLPVNLQKYLILMIANAHRPIYYHGFGIAVLNLETYCKFLRAVFSYYMVFKTFLASD